MKTLHCIVMACLVLAGRAAASSPPNIIVMLVDDMGMMDCSVPFITDAQGRPQTQELNRFYRTPNLEALAARGVRFNQFCAMSVCSPTRISIMTGQNAARHRTTNWINPDTDNAGSQGPPQWNWRGLKPGDITLPALLHQAGYRTIHVGKGHFAPREQPGSNPATLGFDINVAGASIGQPGSYYGLQDFGGKAATQAATNKAKKNAKAQSPKPKRGNNQPPGLEAYHGKDIFLTEALTLEAASHIRAAAAQKQPFFLYFAQYAVHAPFNADPRFIGNYKDSDKPEAAKAFASLVEGMDKSMGDLLKLLDELNIAKDTLVIFLGDNGSDAPLGHEHAVACAAPLRGKKGSHYEGGTRVPMIAAWAKAEPAHPAQQRLPIAAGAIQTQQAAVYDLFPTLLELTNTKTPPAHVVDGRSLAPLLQGKPQPDRPQQFLMHYPHGPHRSHYFTLWRDGDWKVIHHYLPSAPSAGGKSYELYNLRQDPYEQQDLANREPTQLRRMMQGMIEALKANNAVYPMDPQGQPLLPKLP